MEKSIRFYSNVKDSVEGNHILLLKIVKLQNIYAKSSKTDNDLGWTWSDLSKNTSYNLNYKV